MLNSSNGSTEKHSYFKRHREDLQNEEFLRMRPFNQSNFVKQSEEPKDGTHHQRQLALNALNNPQYD